MTKEEYEKLLRSDYWKGYSYSLIKERNFTCQDCGRRFYNERNKLQVHHLVYRDISPWSYNPDEVVVLCERCHKKRHGIIDEPEIPSAFDFLKGYSKSYSYPNESKLSGLNGNNYIKDRSYNLLNSKFRFKTEYLLFLLLFLLLIFPTRKEESKQELTVNVTDRSYEEPAQNDTNFIITSPIKKSCNEPKESVSKSVTQPNKQEISNIIEDTPIEEHVVVEDVSQTEISMPEQAQTERTAETPKQEENKNEPSTLQLLERINHEDVVKRAQKTGVSTEGSTLEIIERMNHADVVKRAQKAGVSTEGSTLEIIERMNHADVVKRAQKAGVSTEGSTLEIIERMNHADVVKRAQKAGVSTEGSTLDILERINRKELEKYNY